MTDASGLLDEFRAYLAQRNDVCLDGFIENFDWPVVERRLSPTSLAVVEHLRAAVSIDDTPEARLVHLLMSAANSLHWGQTYSAGDFGEAFLAGYGWVELFGTRGHFESDVMAGGFLLLGPEIHYPDHHHLAEEIYIPLTSGSLWSKDGGAFEMREAGEIIHHPSNIRHAMRTEGDTLVALYLWRGGPLAQKSVISGRDL